MAFHDERNGSAPRSPACHLVLTAGRYGIPQTLGLDQERIHESLVETGRLRTEPNGRTDSRWASWRLASGSQNTGEHTLQDEDDFEKHFDYIHYNPVKHGLVKCPRDWRWSSFHRWVRAGVYPEDWACWQDGRELDLNEIKKTVGE